MVIRYFTAEGGTTVIFDSSSHFRHKAAPKEPFVRDRTELVIYQRYTNTNHQSKPALKEAIGRLNALLTTRG
jgi:hypothetical protein